MNKDQMLRDSVRTVTIARAILFARIAHSDCALTRRPGPCSELRDLPCRPAGASGLVVTEHGRSPVDQVEHGRPLAATQGTAPRPCPPAPSPTAQPREWDDRERYVSTA